MKSSFIILLFIVSCVCTQSCKNFLDIGPPPTQLTSETVFNSDANAIAAQLAIYADIEASGLLHQILITTAIAGDEAINYSVSPDQIAIAGNSIVATNETIGNIWASWFKQIYRCNAVLEGLNAASSLSDAVRRQLKGEALFMRAFCHFQLTSLFGPVPYIVMTDYQANSVAGREDVAIIYAKITADLIEAKELLGANYVSGTNESSSERVRPNKFAAAALLARMYLYQEQWAKAESEATFVIDNASTYTLTPVPGVFLKNSSEAILQWMATLPGYNTYTGGTLVPSATPILITLSSDLTNAFEASDLRKTNWTKTVASGAQSYVFPFKYQVGQGANAVTEYTMVLRLTELYLIRAEARLKQSDVNGSVSDVNKIRDRAGLAPTVATSTTDIMTAIIQERRVEMFAETGDRWFDLKRTGAIDSVMMLIKPLNWNTTDKLFPIPQVEIDRNTNLSQNLGY